MEGSKFVPVNNAFDHIDLLVRIGNVSQQDTENYIDTLKSDKSKAIVRESSPERQAILVILSRLSEEEYKRLFQSFENQNISDQELTGLHKFGQHMAIFQNIVLFESRENK